MQPFKFSRKFLCVSMICYNGACSQIQGDGHPLMLMNHCVNHGPDLAISDAYETESYFKEVDTFLLQVYQFSKKSGKPKHLLNMLVTNISVTGLLYVKSHSIRLQNHKYCSIKAAIISFFLLCLLHKNMLSSGRGSCKLATTLSSLKGFFEKLQSCNLLATVHFYLLATRITAHLSYTMQNQMGHN